MYVTDLVNERCSPLHPDQYSSHFEKANILFNIACLLSIIAASQNRETEEGLKTACNQFQLAAGVFNKVKMELEKQPKAAECLDLTPDSLNMLNNIMLAQAQECFYERASTNPNASPGALSKIASQVGAFYDLAIALMEQVASLNSMVPRKWLAYCHMKAAVFTSMAQYKLARECEKDYAIGDQLTRLAIAGRLVSKVKKDNHEKYCTELSTFFTAASNVRT